MDVLSFLVNHPGGTLGIVAILLVIVLPDEFIFRRKYTKKRRR